MGGGLLPKLFKKSKNGGASPNSPSSKYATALRGGGGLVGKVT